MNFHLTIEAGSDAEIDDAKKLNRLVEALCNTFMGDHGYTLESSSLKQGYMD